MSDSGWHETVDFVCIGSGLAGCAAAVAAADAGLETLILEKTPLLGGSTVYSYGILWIPDNHLERRDGVQDSRDEGRRYFEYLGAGRQSTAHTEAYLRHAPEALEYFERVAGLRVYMVRGLADHYYPIAPGSLAFGRVLQAEPFPAKSLGEWQSRYRHSPYIERITFEDMASWGGRANERNWDRTVLAEREDQDTRTFGSGLLGYFLRAALALGVRIETEVAAERLIVEDGAVVGLEALRQGERRRIRARGVLIGTGPYGANSRLVGWLDEYPPFPSQRPPLSSQGDGLVLAMEHGGAIAIRHGTPATHLAYAHPGEAQDGFPVGREANLREVAAAHTILVNRDGQRFADESFFEQIAVKLRDFDIWSHRYVNQPCFLIFDQQFWEKYALSPIPAGGPVPAWLERADSVEALAAGLGIHSGNMARTVERFNEFAESGEDQDFHRGETHWGRSVSGDSEQGKNPNLGPLTKPPFYGLELQPADSRSAGLVTTPEGQVVHVRGYAIPGLYACGEVASEMHVGIGYQAGYALTGGMTFGYLAARHAKAAANAG